MGTNNLSQVGTSPVLAVGSQVDQYFNAISGVFVPRNASGVPTDSGASLGSSTYHWEDLWTGDGTNVALFVDGSAGNVGIGTSSPDWRLVAVADNAYDGISIKHYDSGATEGRFNFFHSGSDTVGTDAVSLDGDLLGGIAWYGVDSAPSTYQVGLLSMVQNGAATSTRVPADMLFYTSNTSEFQERMRIDKDGNVGIGTSSPEGLFHINGTNPEIYVETGSGGTSDIIFQENSADVFSISYDGSGSGSANLFKIMSDADGNGTIEYDAFVINRDGKVSIGNDLEVNSSILAKKSSASAATADTGYDNIIVETNGNAGISILTPSSASGGVVFGDSVSNLAGGITYNHNSDQLNFIANGSTRVNISSAGDLEIGNPASPSANSGKVIVLGDNGADPTMGSNTAGIYAKDVLGTVEMFAVDEADNATQLSSHDPLTGEWRFYSKNTSTGRIVEVNLESFFKHYDSVNGTSFFNESKPI